LGEDTEERERKGNLLPLNFPSGTPMVPIVDQFLSFRLLLLLSDSAETARKAISILFIMLLEICRGSEL